MTINGLGGEFALIERIAAQASGQTLQGKVVVGIGDDAAVLTISPQSSILVTTDLLVEDVHFRRSYGDPYSLGVKAAAVNLSDIAAMGGTPTASFISIALPKDTDVAFLDELYRGLNETFWRYGASIAGGDTNLTPDGIVINVVQMGSVAVGRQILRSSARIGDAIIVTGKLGAAAAGFALLEAVGRTEAEQISREVVVAQLRPEPRIEAANAAVASGGVTAMMDLSDGLMGDLAKLCRASGVGAIINAADVPISTHAVAVAERLSANVRNWALRGGEDYELLLTTDGGSAAAVCAAIESTGLRATVVGTITEATGVRLLASDGLPVDAGDGWDHFADGR